MLKRMLLLLLLTCTVGCFGTRNRCCSSRSSVSNSPCCPSNPTTAIPPPGLNQ
jgi:hypothetical protein